MTVADELRHIRTSSYCSFVDIRPVCIIVAAHQHDVVTVI